MTDFIHEQPKTPQENKEPAYVPPKTEKERQKKVYAYILVLFCVAMLLLLWSSMMTSRSNQKTLSELKESTYTMQSIIDEKNAAQRENTELQKQVDDLQAQNEKLEAQIAKLQSDLDALSAEKSENP